MPTHAQVLIIRFSSFGDIFQALEAAKHLAMSEKSYAVDWLVREDFAALLENQKIIRQVYRFNRKDSVFKLMALAWRLAPTYTHVYDAHSNLRSAIVRMTIRIRWGLSFLVHPFGPKRSMIMRSKERLRRFLFFKFRLPTLPVPYRGAESFVRPLRNWLRELEFNFTEVTWEPPKDLESSPILKTFRLWRHAKAGAPIIALAPSAAWPNKRWPVDRWRLFVHEWLKTSPDSVFLLLGGPDDRFLDEIENEFGPSKVFSAVGKSTLLESSKLLSEATALVANDTGLLHVADRLRLPSVAIIGPTAFGYTVSPVSRTAEVPRGELWCKPCSKDGRDPCKNQVHLKCLQDVSTSQVVRELKAAFDEKGET